MNFDVVTLFPGMFVGPLADGVVARARRAGVLGVRVHDLRRWGLGAHRVVDDEPYGGGGGMVLRPEPIVEAVEWVRRSFPAPSERTVLLSPQGRPFAAGDARRMAGLARVIVICGRYEGVDERVALHLADEEVSIGDYVLSGGELAAAVVIDAVARLLPGVLGNEESAKNESFSGTGEESRLDCPQYTRPAEFRGWKVPEVLVSGHHEEIRRWRERAALEKTRRLRPDLMLAGQETGKHHE